MKTSVLLLIHNRPSETRQVLDAIRLYAPEKLYVVADGPRNEIPGEKSMCDEARSVIQEVDWRCQIFTLFRDTNLGCRLSVSGGIDWFFENEEKGIILEDDTLPDPSFFYFCEENLERYAPEESVAMISGNNFTECRAPNGESYFFAPFGGIWGWATWRRAWKNYDQEMGWARAGQESRVFSRLGVNRRAKSYWRWAYSALNANLFDTWDFQWTFSIADRGQLVVVPSLNLVSNIGFGPHATHTRTKGSSRFVRKYALELPLTHPNEIVESLEFQLAHSRQLPERRPSAVLMRDINRWVIKNVLDPVYMALRR